MSKKAVIIVMDSLGAGEMPDSSNYESKGADTIGHIVEKLGDKFDIPNLRKLGYGNIEGLSGGSLSIANPIGCFGKAMEKSSGKDTITGHWEITGIETTMPFKTYPNGFPEEFISKFESEIGRKTLGNYPASGTEIIEVLGDEHEKTGYPIVYTSSDSVFQIAANIDVIPLEELYKICEVARKLLKGKWACGRVIARPYRKVDGKRERTSDRKDYSVRPPKKTLLNRIEDVGQTVYAVGKISDIFGGYGITDSVHITGNMDGVDKTIDALKMNFGGLIFTNLVDFDSKYGHRRNVDGYGKAIMELDSRIPEIIESMGNSDMLILTADHGNDPTYSGFDHTREYIPIVCFGKPLKSGVDLGVRETFADIGTTVGEFLGTENIGLGTSFLEDILK